MKILWMTWKDLKHPLAGGAEVVNEELAKRLVADGHEVLFLVGGYKGALKEEMVSGKVRIPHKNDFQLSTFSFRLVRLGNRYSVYWKAYRYYKKHLVGWADLVIDEINTIPFFAKFYVKEPNIIVAYMLCRKIWFYQLPLPFSLMGWLIEPVYLRLLSDRKVLTESQSAKIDLLRHGFKSENVHVFSVGIEMKPLHNLDSDPSTLKYPEPTLLSLGSIRPMKRTLHQLKAFELAKSKVPSLKLKVAGDASGKYGQKVLRMIQESPYVADIKYLGRITAEQKIELLQKCHAIMVTSVKEGWGLVVTEAASQGTPAVVYDVDGLRDSVQNGKTGLICETNDPADLSDKIVWLFSRDAEYARLQKNAWEWSKQITFEQSHHDFRKILV